MRNLTFTFTCSSKHANESWVPVLKTENLRSQQPVKEVVLLFGRGISRELQIACLIALGFTAFLRWDDLKRHNLQTTSDHMSITLSRGNNDQLREGCSVMLVACTGPRTCAVSLTEKSLRVGQNKESD